MSVIAGKTSNGYDYTAKYQTAAESSICWAATYKLHGSNRGCRDGRVFVPDGLSHSEMMDAVMCSINETCRTEHWNFNNWPAPSAWARLARGIE